MANETLKDKLIKLYRAAPRLLPALLSFIIFFIVVAFITDNVSELITNLYPWIPQEALKAIAALVAAADFINGKYKFIEFSLTDSVLKYLQRRITPKAHYVFFSLVSGGYVCYKLGAFNFILNFLRLNKSASGKPELLRQG